MKTQVEFLAREFNIDFSFPWSRAKALAFIACLNKRGLMASSIKVLRNL